MILGYTNIEIVFLNISCVISKEFETEYRWTIDLNFHVDEFVFRYETDNLKGLLLNVERIVLNEYYKTTRRQSSYKFGKRKP